jgi:hypothetical protein
VRGQDKYQQVCELQHNPAGLPALATRGQPSLLSSTVTGAAPRGYERWWHLPSAYRHMFCIDSRRQIEGTSDGLERFGADKCESPNRLRSAEDVWARGRLCRHALSSYRGLLRPAKAHAVIEHSPISGVEEEGDVALPKTFADRAAVVIAKINIQNGCGGPKAIQKSHHSPALFAHTMSAPAAPSMSPSRG